VEGGSERLGAEECHANNWHEERKWHEEGKLYEEDTW